MRKALFTVAAARKWAASGKFTGEEGGRAWLAVSCAELEARARNTPAARKTIAECVALADTLLDCLNTIPLDSSERANANAFFQLEQCAASAGDILLSSMARLELCAAQYQHAGLKTGSFFALGTDTEVAAAQALADALAVLQLIERAKVAVMVKDFEYVTITPPTELTMTRTPAAKMKPLDMWRARLGQAVEMVNTAARGTGSTFALPRLDDVPPASIDWENIFRKDDLLCYKAYTLATNWLFLCNSARREYCQRIADITLRMKKQGAELQLATN